MDDVSKLLLQSFVSRGRAIEIRGTLLFVAVLLFGSVTFAADEKSTIQNESLRVTADGEAGQFSIQSLPAQKAVVKGARLNGAEGMPGRLPSTIRFSAQEKRSSGAAAR